MQEEVLVLSRISDVPIDFSGPCQAQPEPDRKGSHRKGRVLFQSVLKDRSSDVSQRTPRQPKQLPKGDDATGSFLTFFIRISLSSLLSNIPLMCINFLFGGKFVSTPTPFFYHCMFRPPRLLESCEAFFSLKLS